MALRLTGIEYPPGSGTYISLGDGTDYAGGFALERPYGGLSASVNEVQQTGQSPSLNSISVDGRTIPLTLFRASGAATSDTNFNANVYKWFAPAARASDGDTTRYLRVVWHDGTTVLRIPVNVQNVALRPGTRSTHDIQVRATWPYFEETTAETQVTVGVGTPSNDGNADAPVLLRLTAGSGAIPDSSYRFTITETAGIGVSEVPVLLDVGSAVLTEADTYVFDQHGVSKPFTVTSSRYVWTTCSVGPNETVTMFVFEDATFTVNPLAGELVWGEFYTSNTSNATQEQDGFEISSNPARNGLWAPAQLGFVGGGGSNWGYEITEGSTSGVFTVRDEAAKAKNDANGMVIVTGIPADSITGLSRVTANHSTDIRSFVRYRQAGSANWVDAWTQTGNATVTTTITLVNAVEVAIGIEASGATPTDGATLTLSGTGTPDIDVNLDTARDLSVSGSLLSTDVGLFNGTLTNATTGQVITFDDLIVYDATSSRTLNIDLRHEATQRIFADNTTTGAVFGKVDSLRFSDPVAGFGLAPGSNTINQSLTGTVAVTVDWRNTFG